MPNTLFFFAGGTDVRMEETEIRGFFIRYPGSIPGLGRSPGERNGNPLQYSCLENPMDRRASQAIVHGVTKSWTWLRDEHFCFTRYVSIKQVKIITDRTGMS